MLRARLLRLPLSLTFFMLSNAVISCVSSQPPVIEFPADADPSQEIDKLDNSIQSAASQQEQVLSPANFDSAVSALDAAKDARNKNLSREIILRRVAESRAYLERANGFTNVASQLVPNVVKERQNALAAGADHYYPAEFKDADNALRKVTSRIENNNTANAEIEAAKIAERYSYLELQSLLYANLGQAKDNLQTAVNEGARQVAPASLADTEKIIQRSELIINAERQDKDKIALASKEAVDASNKLIRIVREAKNVAYKSPEQLVKQSESWINERYENARHAFSSEEAAVYKQGNKLLIRLKGLSFKKGSADVNSNQNLVLLQKVEEVVKSFAPAQVVVEGHTDATGSHKANARVSASRAKMVSDYLVSKGVVEQQNVVSKGVADNAPISSNKTASGRAQNRRVDVIISPLEKR